jgi:cob(I)alamin adenosyltransferase
MGKIMESRIVQVFYGPGKGKTSAAVGQCIRAASKGQSVIIIQFLKGNDAEEFNFLEKLEPDIKLFRFEKEKESFSELLASRQKEEKQNILNGVNFARKVIDTGGCDVLVLDEILGLIDLDIISVEDIIRLIQMRDDYTRLVLTGQNLPEELTGYVDVISKIELEKDNTV